jgi:hypothetical protein
MSPDVEAIKARQLHLSIEALLPTEQPFHLERGKGFLELGEAHASVFGQSFMARANL